MPELSNDLLYSQNCFATYQISNAKIINTGFHGRFLKVYFFQLGMTFHGMGHHQTQQPGKDHHPRDHCREERQRETSKNLGERHRGMGEDKHW